MRLGKSFSSLSLSPFTFFYVFLAGALFLSLCFQITFLRMILCFFFVFFVVVVVVVVGFFFFFGLNEIIFQISKLSWTCSQANSSKKRQ